MYEKRRSEFEQNRAEVLKAHLSRDKSYQATRRKTRGRIVFSALQIVIGTVAILALMKTLMLATNSQAEYARIIAPVLQGLDANNPLAKALLPDSMTLTFAEALRPMLQRGVDADVAFGPPMPPDFGNPAQMPDL